MSKHRFDHTVDHTLDRMVDTKPEGLQRIEVITGVGGRRRWSSATKARVLMESFEAGAVVSEVARRHGLSPQQLFGWRQQARKMLVDGDAARDARALAKPEEVAFAPVVVNGAVAKDATTQQFAESAGVMPDAALIEIALGGAVVRVRGSVDAKALIAVLKALKVAS